MACLVIGQGLLDDWVTHTREHGNPALNHRSCCGFGLRVSRSRHHLQPWRSFVVSMIESP